MKIQIVEHYQINGRYKIQYEQAATKGVIGWKVEVNGDDLATVNREAIELKAHAEQVTMPSIVTPVPLPDKEK